MKVVPVPDGHNPFQWQPPAVDPVSGQVPADPVGNVLQGLPGYVADKAAGLYNTAVGTPMQLIEQGGTEGQFADAGMALGGLMAAPGLGSDEAGVLSTGATGVERRPYLLPAIRTDGKIFRAESTGDVAATHFDALDKIPQEFRGRYITDANNRGYVNDKGKFMSRYAAQNYAVSNGLLSPDAPSWAATSPELISETLAPQSTRRNLLPGDTGYIDPSQITPVPEGHNPFVTAVPTGTPQT